MSEKKDSSKPAKNRVLELQEANWPQIVDEHQIRRSIVRIAHEIVEKNNGAEQLAVVGIRTRGELLAKRICNLVEEIEGKRPEEGVVDITLYRDDLAGTSNGQPLLRATEFPFNVDQHHVVLVDDVLYTGRTIRAALDAINDFGRPKSVRLAVLCDRGHREVPIRADYIGRDILTAKSQNVRVCLKERDGGDAIYLSKLSSSQPNIS